MTTPKYDLPTAMRTGAKRRPQTRYVYFDDFHTRSCALGAAYEGETKHVGGWNIGYDMRRLWPELNVEMGDGSLYDTISFLNDQARWSREEIADWLDYILP